MHSTGRAELGGTGRFHPLKPQDKTGNMEISNQIRNLCHSSSRTSHGRKGQQLGLDSYATHNNTANFLVFSTNKKIAKRDKGKKNIFI